MPVSISEAWWKNLWAKKVKAQPHRSDASVINAIKAYKAALRGKKHGDVLDALDKLHDELVSSVDRNLKRKDLDINQKDVLDYGLGGGAAHIADKKKAAQNAGGTVKTIYKINFGTVVNRVHKSPLVIKVDREIEMTMMDLVIDELAASGADAMLYAEVDKHVEAAARNYAGAVDDYFNANIGKIGKKEMDAFSKKTADAELKDLGEKLKRVPTDIMKKVRVHRDIAQKYRKEKAIAIGRGAAGAAMGVGGVFVPGNQPFAAVMAARSCASLAKEIAETAMSLKAKVKALKICLSALEKAYDKHKGEKEIALDAVNAVLGIDVVPTIGKAEGQLADIGKDLKTTFHRARVANKKVMKAIESMEKIEAKINRSGLKGMKKSALNMKLKRARRELDGLVDSVYRLMKHATFAEAKVPELQTRLDDIGKLSGRVEKAKVAIRGALAVGTALGGAGDASAASQVAETAEKVAALGLAFEGTMEDVIDTVNDINSLS